MVNANRAEGIKTILADIQSTITNIYKKDRNNNIYTVDAIVEKIADMRYAKQFSNKKVGPMYFIGKEMPMP
jgi:hypothetical protein